MGRFKYLLVFVLGVVVSLVYVINIDSGSGDRSTGKDGGGLLDSLLCGHDAAAIQGAEAASPDGGGVCLKWEVVQIVGVESPEGCSYSGTLRLDGSLGPAGEGQELCPAVPPEGWEPFGVIRGYGYLSVRRCVKWQ